MAKQTRTALASTIAARMPDNALGEISAADLRATLGDFLDSIGVAVQDGGQPVGAAGDEALTLNFTGAGVALQRAGAVVTATISGGGGAAALSFGAAAPSNPASGQGWGDTDGRAFRIYDGSAWLDVAQLNPRWQLSFSMVRADAADLADGEIGFYAGAAQVVAGQLDQADRIYVSDRGGPVGEDPTDSQTDLTAVDTRRVLQDAVDNGGLLLISVADFGGTATAYASVRSASAVSGGYLLSDLVWSRSYDLSDSSTTGVVVAAARTTTMLLADLADGDDVVRRADLEGRETDRFASYDVALFGGQYFPGFFCLFSGSAQPTDDTDAVAPADLATGNYAMAWGPLRLDSDPDRSPTTEALAAADWPSGRVAYVSPWHPYQADAHMRIVLSADATLVGAGNGQHLWAPVSVVEVGDVASASDYFRWSLDKPSGLDVDLPPTAISRPPWIVDPTASVGENALAAATPILVSTSQGWRRTTLGEVVEWHDDHHTGTATITGFSRVVGAPAAAGQVRWVSPGGHANGVLTIHPVDDGQEELLLAKFGGGKKVRLIDGDGDYLEAETVGSAGETGGHLFVATRSETASGSVAASGSGFSLEIENNIPARGEIARQAFVEASPNVAGAGGSQYMVWRRGASATAGFWGRIVASCMDWATAAKRAAFRYGMSTGQYALDVAGSGDFTLSTVEAAYDSLKLTGARTADCVITVPARPAWPLAVVHEATGAHSVSVKAAGQADSAAVALLPGDNVVLRHGGSVGLHRAYEAPTPILNLTAVPTAWTTLSQDTYAYTDDSEFEARLNGLADGSRRIATAKFALGDLDANAWWLPWGAGAAAGFRIEFRRSAANTLQYRRQPAGFATYRLRLIGLP